MSVASVKYSDICDDCTHKGYCDMAQFGGHNPRITACSHFVQSKRTNYDRLISKSPEEIAEFMANVQRAGSYGRAGAVFDYIDITPDMVTLWLDWLKQEAEEGET